MAPPRMPRKFVKPPPPKRQEDEIRIGEPLADHELFLTAFEKPTQIYRYLETRHSESPIFLHRNLSYMRGYRMSRKKNTRNLGLDNIISMLRKFHEETTAMLNLNFVGFYEANSKNGSSVQIGTYLIKKSSDRNERRLLIGKYKVPINANKNTKSDNDVCIFIDDFKKDENTSSCALEFIVQIPTLKSNSRNSKPKSPLDLSSDKILVWTKQNFHLTDGLYEVAFEVNSNKENQAAPNNRQWRSVRTNGKKEDLKFSACLRFHLTLSGLNIKRNSTKFQKNEYAALKKPIVFQFLYGKSSQTTDASHSPSCPWCTVDCGSLYSLLKHLRLCHERFCFRYSSTSKKHQISVIVNEYYDGSHEGGPYEYSFNQSCLTPGPKRKYPCTKILVHHSKKPEPNLSEFTKFVEYEDRPFIEGHHRLYYHSVSGIPKYPNELSDDSEDEKDPQWLKDSLTRMVDSFRDVNKGEKEIMKMWNLHVLKNGYIGDCQMELACNTFIEQEGDEIVTKKLYRNFLVHLSNMVDYELITAKTLLDIVKKLQEKLKKCDSSQLVEMFAVHTCPNGRSEKKNGQCIRKKRDYSPLPKRNLRRKT
ncbi:hypothetical protein HHI36_021865 [Cryptolaemus montrouzieri]|uniref:Polycomb protein VEFS-Box domain-containing protein n=1 Tax=Cryptolaemus montrouzieri TaxID=559131 RepID=A0ABD2MYC7_9CUCU